jgi:hypothetical protein
LALAAPDPTQSRPKGWPWADGTFSWVEPTSWALIALKRLRPRLENGPAGDRIREGEAMLYDRMCQGGGWNYGNTLVLGEELPPYPDTTALALVALADHAEAAANRQSLDALQKMLTGMDSGFTLALAVLCLLLHGQEPADWRRALARSYERSGFLGVNRSLALTVLALTEGQARLRV